jgi:hypothetical protein
MTEPGSQAGEDGNGQLRRYRLIRGYVVLGVGVGLIVIGATNGINPAILTLGGTVIGFDPMVRAASGSSNS